MLNFYNGSVLDDDAPWIQYHWWAIFLEKVLSDQCFQGFHAYCKLLESPGIFIGKFRGPGKFWKMTLDLESPSNLLARYWKSWILLGNWYVWQFWASNRHVSADEDGCNCCHQVRFLGCRYAKNAFTAGSPPQTPLVELTVLPRHLAAVRRYI